jgi:hypothetical protein
MQEPEVPLGKGVGVGEFVSDKAPSQLIVDLIDGGASEQELTPSRLGHGDPGTTSVTCVDHRLIDQQDLWRARPDWGPVI